MDNHEQLVLTPKGIEEVKHRTFKLNVKKRSLLILLAVSPMAVGHLRAKAILPAEEFETGLKSLVDDGFISGPSLSGRSGGSPDTGPRSVTFEPTTHASATHNRINRDIALAEAKFLLTDFCVDCFGTDAQIFAEGIRAVTDVQGFCNCLTRVWAATKAGSPEQLKRLAELISEINDTA